MYESKSGTAKPLRKIANTAELSPASNGDKLLSLQAAARAGALARLVILWLAAATTTAWCQGPVVSSVVDAASYAPTQGRAWAIATIFGTNLASTTASAVSAPLPTQLGGTRVEWNGVAAPLFYVSPTQINFQVPVNLDSGTGTPGIVVSTVAGASLPYRPEVETPDAVPVGGLFSADASGCGQAAVLNVSPYGYVSANSPSNSAAPGDWISAFGTGIVVDPAKYPPDGEPAPLTSIIRSSEAVGATGEFDLGRHWVSPGFDGLAPGLVGMAQTNLQIPTTVREGCAVPFQLWYGRPKAMSQPVTIAIRRGGGACVDPPEAGYGEIRFERTVATSATNTVSEWEGVTVSLQASPGKQPGKAYTSGPSSDVQLFGPACPIPGYRSLDAGSVMVQGPAIGVAPAPPMPYQEGPIGGLTAYQAVLPKGALQAGTHVVRASGGRDVGPFEVNMHIGADIQLQTPLAGVKAWADCAPLDIRWTGGDPDSWVTIWFIRLFRPSEGGFEWSQFKFRTRASTGGVTIPAQSYPGTTPRPGTPRACYEVGPIRLSIEVEPDTSAPDPSAMVPLTAAGLSLGGHVTWKYIHSFEGTMSIQH